MGTASTVGLLAGIRPTGIALFALLSTGISLEAAPREYIVLQVPGCQLTIPWAVNERGDVVGSALSCAGDDQGFAFLYRDGIYTSIDVPGQIATYPTDINERGVVVGYFTTPEHAVGAFTFWRGEFQTISVPGVELVPQGINNRGDITGWIPTVSYQAFLLTKNGDFTLLTVDGLEGLQAWKINASGIIVGSAFSPALGIPVSFVSRRGDSRVAELPGNYSAINDRGDVAADVQGSGFVIYRMGAPLDLNHPETGYTIFDLSNRWAVGALPDGRGYLLRLP